MNSLISQKTSSSSPSSSSPVSSSTSSTLAAKTGLFARLQHSKRKKQYLAAIIILLIGVLAFVALKSMKKPPAEKPVVDNTPVVSVQPLVVAPKTLQVSSYGVVAPKYQTEVTAQVSGVIVELAEVFERGGFVKKGQVLAKIDPSDYQAALLDAQSKVAAAKASLETELAQGQVALKEWQQISDATPTELSLRKPQLAQEQARLDAAKAALMRAKRDLQRSEIKAPFDAIIANRAIGLGSFVGKGSNIGQLLNTDVAQVRLPVADKELQFLSNDGVNAQVVLTAKVANNEFHWPATIKREEGVIDNSNRMHYLVAEITDPYQLLDQNSPLKNKQAPLRFGAYVQAQIQGLHLEQTVTIDRQHLINGQVPLYSADASLSLLAMKMLRQEGNQLIFVPSAQDIAYIGKQPLVVTPLEFATAGMKIKLVEQAAEQDDHQDKLLAQSQVAEAGNNSPKTKSTSAK